MFRSRALRETPKNKYPLRIFQRNGIRIHKDLKISGLVQNVCIYRNGKVQENLTVPFLRSFQSWEKCMDSYDVTEKWRSMWYIVIDRLDGERKTYFQKRWKF